MNALTPDEQDVVKLVAEWVDAEVRPGAGELERSDRYPERYIAQMKSMGIFGLLTPPEYGGVGASTACFARVSEELARGWMSLSGAMGGHNVIARLLTEFGTQAQRTRYLPRMATGDMRAAMALTEPASGSDLQSMRTVARREGAEYEMNGVKTWITNSRRAGLIAVLCKTDTAAEPPHRGMSLLLAEPGPGLHVSRDLPKLGYRGVESCEVVFDGYRLSATAVLGEEEGRGFAQMMKGLETGRVQVAARALGVARAAFDETLRYSQERETFGKPIWQHQSIGNYLADMATKIHASRLLIMDAAQRIDAGGRADLEAGMAKLYASEACLEVVRDAMRVHGAYGYSTEFNIERYYRDAPLMVIGEGTNEIQRNVMARQLALRGELDL